MRKRTYSWKPATRINLGNKGHQRLSRICFRRSDEVSRAKNLSSFEVGALGTDLVWLHYRSTNGDKLIVANLFVELIKEEVAVGARNGTMVLTMQHGSEHVAPHVN